MLLSGPNYLGLGLLVAEVAVQLVAEVAVSWEAALGGKTAAR